MKSKPAKGSARTKRFDVGGTVGALAGLGTLAYLLSRKKKDAATGNEGSGESTAKPVIKSMMDTEDDAAKQRAMAASKGRPEMGDATNDDITTKKTTTPAVKKTTPSVKATAPAAKTTAPATAVKGKDTSAKDKGFGKSTQLSSDSDAAKAMRQSRAQRLGATYNAQYKALQSAPEGPGKEALKKSVAKAKADYEDAAKGMKKGGTVKKYAAGGTTTSKPEPKKAPMPDFAREAKENRERDQRVKKEQEAYDKGAPTRLKDQGSFKNGGMTASKRADGIAMRGKTRGKMY